MLGFSHDDFSYRETMGTIVMDNFRQSGKEPGLYQVRIYRIIV